MPIRFYICNTIGTGDPGRIEGQDSDPYRPATYKYSKNYEVIDFRHNSALSGELIVKVNDFLPVHAAIKADPDITLIPFEDNTGNYLGFNDTLASIAPAKRAVLLSRLEQMDVPTDKLTGASTIKDLLKTVIRRARIRQLLRSDDIDLAAGGIFADLLPEKRQRIRSRLAEAVSSAGAVFDDSISIKNLCHLLIDTDAKADAT